MKSLIILFLGILLSPVLTAQSTTLQGARTGNSQINTPIPGSVRNWSDMYNASGSDDQYSSFGNLHFGSSVDPYTDYLVVTNFGFNLPANSIITGIVAEVERSDPDQRTLDYSVKIVKGGVVTGADKSTATAYPATDTYNSYGSAADTWGTSWTSNDINSPGFGLAIAAQRINTSGITSGRVDDIKITVYYTSNIITLPVVLSGFNAYQYNKQIQLSWKTTQESQMSNYVIERSADGAVFSPIGTVNSLQNNSANNYSFTDVQPASGLNYYRLRMTSLSGDTKYSAVTSVHLKNSGTVSLYPTLLQPGQPVYLKGNLADGALVQLATANGQPAGLIRPVGNTLDAGQIRASNGILYYTIYNKQQQVTGSGQLVIQ